MWGIGLLEGTFCTMFTGGILSSWVYLRFYQLHSNGTRGDTTDFFTFARYMFWIVILETLQPKMFYLVCNFEAHVALMSDFIYSASSQMCFNPYFRHIKHYL